MESVGAPFATVGDALPISLEHVIHHWSFNVHWQIVHMSQLWSPQLASVLHFALANVVWSDKIIWHTISLLHVGNVCSVVVVVLVMICIVVCGLLVESVPISSDIIYSS